MPKPSADMVVTQKHIRFFYQPFGPGPDNPIYYAGLDGQYMIIEDQTNPKRGSRSRINVHDLHTPGNYLAVGDSIEPPDYPSATVQFMQKHGAVPQHLIGYDCPVNFYQVTGNCKDLSDMLDGATDYWKTFSRGTHETSTEKGGSFDSDEGLQDGLDFTYDYIYPYAGLSFGEEGETEVTLEIIDGVYGSRLSCGACGPEDDGTKLWYGIQINDTGIPPDVKYTTDGFETMATAVVTGSIDTDIPVAIDIVGNNLVVVYNGVGDNGYYVAPINELTGVPGTFVKVTNGFVAASDPNDIWVANPREVYFAGDGGYIYKSESILQGVTPIHEADVTTLDLYRITALEEVIIAVGETGAIVVSYNRGGSFSAPVVAATAQDINAVALRSKYEFWVGDAAGDIFYTTVRGEIAWTTFISGLTFTAVDDIVWANSEIGYITAQESGPVATMLASFTGGRNWSRSDTLSGRFINWSVFDVGNRISYPAVESQGVLSNFVVVCGLAGDGADGIILYGKANITP